MRVFATAAGHLGGALLCLLSLLLTVPAAAQKAAHPPQKKRPQSTPPPGAIVDPKTGHWFRPTPPPPAPVTPTERPLSQALHFTREHSFYPSGSATDPLTHQIDTVQVTFEYVAPGESADQATYGVWWPEPQRRHLDDFTPHTTPHFRLAAIDSFGTVVRYYPIMGQPTRELFTGMLVYPTYCVTHYPKGHPSAPDTYRPNELESDFTRAREVVLDLKSTPPKLIIRVPKVEGYHRFE